MSSDSLSNRQINEKIAELEGLWLDENQVVTHDGNSLGLIGKKYDPVNDWKQGGLAIERHRDAIESDWLSDDSLTISFIVNMPDTILKSALLAIINYYDEDS